MEKLKKVIYQKNEELEPTLLRKKKYYYQSMTPINFISNEIISQTNT